MVILENLSSLSHYLKQNRSLGKTIGLVPTMGALHPGHLALIQLSCEQNDLTVCSIYVNPTQFNNPSDLQLYPRTLEADVTLLTQAGCNAAFVPTNEVMYPYPSSLQLYFGDLERVMEGKYRPGHFNGVALVVSKLLHMVQPDRAYFGQKDLQQFLIISRLVMDLSFNVQLISCPIVRDPDGLAMSSRNARLTPQQRAIASVLYKTLTKAAERLAHQSVVQIKTWVQEQLSTVPGIRLEYFEVADGQNLREVAQVQEHAQVALCLAAYVGEVRLIDNLLIDSKDLMPA